MYLLIFTTIFSVACACHFLADGIMKAYYNNYKEALKYILATLLSITTYGLSLGTLVILYWK